MKISGSGRSSGPSSTNRTTKSVGPSASGFVDHLQGAAAVEETASAHGLEAPQALSGLESLLAIQAVDADGSNRGRRRMIARGEELLDRLEDIRRGLLLGTIPIDRLSKLSEMVRSKRDSGADPELAALLDEIELRAEVELAKLGMR